MTMTEQEWTELGQRAARAVPLERWPEGAKLVDRHGQWIRLLDVDEEGDRWAVTWEGEHVCLVFNFVVGDVGADWTALWMGGGAWPDFREHATRGCALALVEEAFGVSDVTVRPIYVDDEVDRWALNSTQIMDLRKGWNSVLGVGPTRAHALVAAIEAAGGAS